MSFLQEQPPPWPDEDPAYYEPGYYQPGYDEPDYDEPDYDEPGPGGEAYGPDEYYQDPGDGFAGQPEPDGYLDDVADLRPLEEPRGGQRYRGTGRNSGGRGGRKRLAGIVVAAASVLGVALLAPTILTAAKKETLTGVVARSNLNGLNFAVTGRVARIRVRLGQLVRKGQLLAREIAPAGAISALRTDRTAIVADQADVAALLAAGAPAASVTAARGQLSRDRLQRAADQAAMVIRAPMAGTVVAVFGRAGDPVTQAGLAGPATAPAATQLSALTLASLRGGGRELPVIALRTAGRVQVRLLIPAESPAPLRVGSVVSLSVPAARLTRLSGVLTELSERPASTGGGDVAVIEIRGNSAAGALTGMRADVDVSS